MGNRISPDQVLAAYKATGLKPTREKWLGAGCACALGVLAISKGAREVYSGEIVRTLEITREYMGDFLLGFDGKPAAPRSTLGYADGKAAAEAVFDTMEKGNAYVAQQIREATPCK